VTHRVRPPTRERILEAALGLLNACGEGGVTIAGIADAVQISQGNLHYHFRTRTAIVEALLTRFEQAMDELIGGEVPARVTIDDAWLFLRLLIDTVDRHRFLIRDLEPIGQRAPRLARRVRRLLVRQADTLRSLCSALAANASGPADPALIGSIARAMALGVIFSTSYERWVGMRGIEGAGSAAEEIADCAASTLALAAPLLDRKGRAALRRIQPERTPTDPPRRSRT
jgi:AcrR family transcriptional regulator